MPEYFANSAERVPSVMTSLECAKYLRVDEGSPNDAATLKRLDRITAKKILKPILIGGKRRYPRTECDRYVESLMEPVI